MVDRRHEADNPHRVGYRPFFMALSRRQYPKGTDDASQSHARPRHLLTIEQAAKRAFSSVSTIKRRIKAGKLPAVRNGRKLYVSEEDLAKLFDVVPVSEEERFEELAKQLAAQAPTLSAERKARLAALLS